MKIGHLIFLYKINKYKDFKKNLVRGTELTETLSFYK